MQEPPFEGEEALFDKSRLLSLLPFSHHASQIAICSRSATRQCLPQANLQSRRSRGQDTSLALAASHTVGARARPLFFALSGKKSTLTSAKTFKKEGKRCEQSKKPQNGMEFLIYRWESGSILLPQDLQKKGEGCEQSEKPQTVDLFWFIVGV